MADQDPNHWTQDDAVNLRTFIAGNPKFLRVLAKRRPQITGGTMEERAVTGSDANGFLAAVDAIESMQQDPVQNSDDAGFMPSSE